MTYDEDLQRMFPSLPPVDGKQSRPQSQPVAPAEGIVGALEQLAESPMFKKMLGGVEDKPARVQDRYVRNLKATGIWVPLALLLTGLVIAFLIILANLTPLIIAMISKWMV